jgi:hypothetical protein
LLIAIGDTTGRTQDWAGIQWDMVIDLIHCFSCGALVPDMNGPTHPYMESSPGCWHVYGEILARQFSDPGLRDVQRLTADTYAVQHPGRPSPVAIQSVCGHLMSLCVVLEKHAPYSYADQVLRAAVNGRIPLWWLTPPRSPGALTVVDVKAAASADEHREKVHAWAQSAWSAWAEHHDTIRTWTARV